MLRSMLTTYDLHEKVRTSLLPPLSIRKHFQGDCWAPSDFERIEVDSGSS